MTVNFRVKKDTKWSILRLFPTFICFFLFSCEAIYGVSIDPADKLERAAHQKRIQNELAYIPEEARLLEDKGTHFIPFKGCINIKHIELVGEKIFCEILQKQNKTIISHYLKRCITAKDLNDLIIKLNTVLFTEGYITARIGIDKYSKNSGQIIFKIQEGHIEKVETSAYNRYTAFPGLVGKLLRAQDLDQGVEQLNRLPSQRSLVTLWPGKNVGDTIIKVDAKKIGNPYRLYLAFDNSGNKQTGPNVAKWNFAYDNLFSLNDQLTIAGSKSGLGKDRSEAVTWREEIPFGYYTIDYSGSYSYVKFYLYPDNNDSSFITNSFKHKLSISRNIYRGLNNHIILHGSFWHYIQDRDLLILPTVKERLSVLELGMQHNYYNNQFRIRNELSLGQGINVLGAKIGINEAIGAQRRYKLTSDYLWIIAKNIHVNGNLALQYAANKIHGTMKVPIIDESFGIRGSKEGGLNLDDGAVLRHDIIFPLYISSVTKPNLFKEAVISPFIHGDIGYGRDKDDAYYYKFYALGGGFKMNILGFNGQVTASRLFFNEVEPKIGSWAILFDLNLKIL